MSGRIYIGDFEVFRYDTMLCLIDCYAGEYIDIINDKYKLKAFYNSHKDDIFVFYNGRRYDKWIYKAWVLGYSQEELYKLSQALVVEHVDGWAYDSKFNNIQLFDYDVAKISDGGLKSLEAFMGENIIETSVDFDIDRPLTPDELEMTRQYCHSDIDNTFRVFMERKADFDATMAMIKTFKMPLSYVSKTHAQLGALALGCVKQKHDDEFDVEFVDTLRLGKYEYIKEWFIEQLRISKEQGEYTTNPLITTVAGTQCVFKWGGAHGCIPHYQCDTRKKDVILLHCDVQSFYPSLMIAYGFLTRNCATPERYKEIFEKRLALKAAGKKREQAPFKVILNSNYGITKDKFSIAEDSRQANCVCLNGQLLLTDLMLHLEEKLGSDLVVSNVNTDGIIIEIPNTDEAFEIVDDVCYEWEQRTHCNLGFDWIEVVYMKDVNNYVFRFDNGALERKGSYLQESTPLKKDLAILNEALVSYLMDGVPLEKTIYECNDLSMFQKVVKVSSKYENGWYNGEKLRDKTFRVFASLNKNNGSIYKQKTADSNLEKFANTPVNAVIYNGALKDATCESIGLDKEWYLTEAKKRLKSILGE